MDNTLSRPVVVQKYGGTTISGVDALPKILKTIKTQLNRGFKVVAVVSAMGRGPNPQTGESGEPYATDSLLNLLPDPQYVCLREKDLMMMCGEVISAVTLSCYLRQSGIACRARTGFEAGIITDNNSNNARIQTIVPTRLMQDLKLMDVVVVAGFQGISHDGRITTLGRGGSDTTAIALGHALKAQSIEIYTDQKGIFSADPRVVPEAVHLDRLNAKDIIHMAWAGAKVLHPRAAEMIDRFGLNVTVGSIGKSETATVIEVGEGYESSMLVTAIAHGSDVTQFSVIRANDDNQAQLAEVFNLVTSASVSMDMFTVTETLIRFTIAQESASLIQSILSTKGYTVETTGPCQKVSIVGAGMHGISGVMARFTSALVAQGVKILQTVDSHATISALVKKNDAVRAQTILHREFI